MVDYNGLENRRTERYRGFESLSLRKEMEDVATDTFHFFIVDNQYYSATCKGKSR